MRKAIIVILFFGLLLSGIAEAKSGKKGNLSVGAKVSMYNPPGDASSTLLFEVTAQYRFSDHFTGELSVGWTQYSSGGETVTLMPIQLNGEFHPLGRQAFDPYLGAGTGVYLQQVGETTDATMGVQALGGLAFHPTSGFSFNAEVKYMLADITDKDSGGLTFGGGVEGNWEMDL